MMWVVKVTLQIHIDLSGLDRATAICRCWHACFSMTSDMLLIYIRILVFPVVAPGTNILLQWVDRRELKNWVKHRFSVFIDDVHGETT